MRGKLLGDIQIEERTFAELARISVLKNKTAFMRYQPPYGERSGGTASNRSFACGLSALFPKELPKSMYSNYCRTKLNKRMFLAFEAPETLRCNEW